MLHFVVLMCICEKYFHSSVYTVYKNFRNLYTGGSCVMKQYQAM